MYKTNLTVAVLTIEYLSSQSIQLIYSHYFDLMLKAKYEY